jgi:Zn-dependent M28 family amino/carboxypeptidase
MLHAMAVPLNDLGMAGARATSSRRLGGSDYTSFNQAGLPGISMGQDPIRYNSHTWHTNLDTYEQVLEDDVKQAAVVVASIAWQLAVHDRLLPRFVDAEMPRLNVGTE